MSTPEFVRIDGEVVRVTSLRIDEATGDMTLVVVARGSVARHQLTAIAARPTLRFEVIDGAPEEIRYVKEADVRSTGEFEQTMTRLRLELITTPPVEQPEDIAESQLDRIERKLDQVLEMLSRD